MRAEIVTSSMLLLLLLLVPVVAVATCSALLLLSQVCAEFSELHRQLTDVAGVKVSLFQHDLRHGTPDACFPNNWFSTHAAEEAVGGVGARTLVLYPMKCPNRAAERRPEIIQVCVCVVAVLYGWFKSNRVSDGRHPGRGSSCMVAACGVPRAALPAVTAVLSFTHHAVHAYLLWSSLCLDMIPPPPSVGAAQLWLLARGGHDQP